MEESLLLSDVECTNLKVRNFCNFWPFLRTFQLFLDWGCNIFLCTIPQKANEQEVTLLVFLTTLLGPIAQCGKKANFTLTQKLFREIIPHCD